MKRQIWKRFLILTLCAAMLFTTTACNTNRPGSSDEPKEKTELIIGLNSDITTHRRGYGLSHSDCLPEYL